MKELIKITEQNGRSAVSMKELYSFLEVRENWTDWTNRMLSYGFIENIDYQAVSVFRKHPNGIGGTNIKDYALSLDCAKEISMLQRTEKGKQARQYFIECEKKLNNPIANITKKDLAIMLLESEEEKERLEATVKLQKKEIKESAPKVIYYDEVLQSKATYNTNLIAKELGMSAITLNRKLQEMRIQYKQNGTWLLYHNYQDRGYTKTKTHSYTDTNGLIQTSMQTVWTEKGRAFIHNIMTENQQLKKNLT